MSRRNRILLAGAFAAPLVATIVAFRAIFRLGPREVALVSLFAFAVTLIVFLSVLRDSHTPPDRRPRKSVGQTLAFVLAPAAVGATIWIGEVSGFRFWTSVAVVTVLFCALAYYFLGRGRPRRNDPANKGASNP